MPVQQRQELVLRGGEYLYRTYSAPPWLYTYPGLRTFAKPQLFHPGLTIV